MFLKNSFFENKFLKWRYQQTFTTPRSKRPSASPATTVCPNPKGGSVGEAPPLWGLPIDQHVYDMFEMWCRHRKLSYIYNNLKHALQKAQILTACQL